MTLNQLPVLEVTWEDHYSTEEWMAKDAEDLDASIYVTSVGYLLKETKTKVILFQNAATNGHVSCTMTILKKTIKDRVIIREGTK